MGGMNSTDGRIDTSDWSLLCLLAFLWGGSFFFAGVAVRELPPLTVVLFRVTLGAAFLLPVLWRCRIGLPRTFAAWKPYAAVALFNNVLPFSLFVTAQTSIASGLASILNATTPLFTIGVMVLSGEERLSARRIAGVAIGLIGVVILRGGVDVAKSGTGVAILLCLAGALSYGLAALTARRYLEDSPPLATATFQLLASSAMMTVVAGIVERPWQLPLPSATTLAAMIGFGALSTALAYIVFFQIVRRSGASNVMLVTLLIPVTAILLGYLLLGEHISSREITGALVIGSALLLIDGRVPNLLARLALRNKVE
jgi:drug/metabolite transporter (DMT)-like permease